MATAFRPRTPLSKPVHPASDPSGCTRLLQKRSYPRGRKDACIGDKGWRNARLPRAGWITGGTRRARAACGCGGSLFVGCARYFGEVGRRGGRTGGDHIFWGDGEGVFFVFAAAGAPAESSAIRRRRATVGAKLWAGGVLRGGRTPGRGHTEGKGTPHGQADRSRGKREKEKKTVSRTVHPPAAARRAESRQLKSFRLAGNPNPPFFPWGGGAGGGVLERKNPGPPTALYPPTRFFRGTGEPRGRKKPGVF